MAQATDTITINDGLATPVARTFKCSKASPELTVYKDRRLTKPAYWPEITISADLPATTAKTRKGEVRTSKPVVDAVTGIVTDVIRFRTVADIPVSATQAEVDDAYAFHVNAQSHSLVKGAVKDADPIIG